MTLRVREFRVGDELALREVFFSSVHTLASRDYTPAQLAAWAPPLYDAPAWAERLRGNRPFVAEIGGAPAGFADLQDTGYIDQFFVAGGCAGRGVGQALMAHLHASARRRGIHALWANVSLRAEPFFTRHGFVVEIRQVVERAGLKLRNARMHKPLGDIPGAVQPTATDAALAQRLVHIVQASPATMAALHAVRALRLPDWCIGAGAIRNLVWDHLHQATAPSAPPDVDVAYFDAADSRVARDASLQATLAARLPHVPWEVTNQAGVHRWFEAVFGHAVAPLRSLEESVATWPEVATCIGVRLENDGALRVIAPLGLADLFAMVVRHNPARASAETYRQRMAQKRFTTRWPGVTVLPG